jgi:phage tail-like protein
MALNDTSIVGLVNRFTVTIDGQKVYNLGSWYKVDGLEVTWDVPDARVGDQVNYRFFAPANTKYVPVKLSRAANDADSAQVRAWLNETQRAHVVGNLATIKLQDANHTKDAGVIEWELRNVMPAKWSISTFDAAGSAVAVEILELQHEGFLEVGPILS